ncbi:longitudinals lacking protein-like [Lepeophtheirus salmonis]|nr:transcription factor Ken 1-like [Lepeophtheirus salmonis]
MSSSESEQSPEKENNEKSAPKLRTFKFPAHQSHMLSLAKMCQENKTYADCVIQCDTGVKLKAHRLVLGSASSFLKLVFDEVPPSLYEATVMVPGVKVLVVRALLDFLYTGEMSVGREDTTDLQLLLDTLRIDPSLISVDVETNKKTSPSEPGSSNSSSSSEGGGGAENEEDQQPSSSESGNSLKRKNKDTSNNSEGLSDIKKSKT